MIAAILWSIIATTGCVMLDRQKDELKEMLIHCQDSCRGCLEETELLQGRNAALKVDTTWMREHIRRDIEFLNKLICPSEQ
jgi:hypothetical protein